MGGRSIPFQVFVSAVCGEQGAREDEASDNVPSHGLNQQGIMAARSRQSGATEINITVSIHLLSRLSPPGYIDSPIRAL